MNSTKYIATIEIKSGRKKCDKYLVRSIEAALIYLEKPTQNTQDKLKYNGSIKSLKITHI